LLLIDADIDVIMNTCSPNIVLGSGSKNQWIWCRCL